MDFLYGAAGGGVVGVVAFVFGCFLIGYIKRIISERDALLERRTAAIERKLEETDEKLEKHVAADQTETINVQLRIISGNIEKILSQQSALLVGAEASRQQILTLFNSQTRLEGELKDCKRDHR